MNGWYLGFGIFGLVYFAVVGYFGAIKKSPGFLKLVKMKLNKNMSDEAAVKVCTIAAIIFGLVGIFLLVYGAIVS